MQEQVFDKEIIEDTQYGKYLIFKVGIESYGIEIKHVTEIIGIQAITQMPELPPYIKGIINLRGRIIPVMDVRTRFKMPVIEYNDRTCIIIADISDMSIGLIIDSVSEVINITDENIVAPPELGRNTNKFLKSIGKVGNEVKLLLEYNKLLTEEDESILSVI
ncbi:MAG: chemotaxis protein CheW [Eubacteriales bacterium]